MTSMTPADFFGGSGAPSAKFERPGDTVTGTIVDLTVVQQRAYSPTGLGDLLTWDDGRPMMQLNVTLQTTLRDPSIKDDDGRRRVYVKGKRLTGAVKKAFAAAGAKGLEEGGEYTQTFIGYDPESKNPANPAKDYSVEYRRPNPAAGFFGGQQPTPAAQPAYQQPAQQVPAPQPAAAPAIDGAALQAALANLPPEVLAAMQQKAS